jgi:hypothetical protein
VDTTELDKPRFAKLLRDGLLVAESGPLPARKVDAIYARVLPASCRAINFVQFLEGLRYVALQHRISLNEVYRQGGGGWEESCDLAEQGARAESASSANGGGRRAGLWERPGAAGAVLCVVARGHLALPPQRVWPHGTPLACHPPQVLERVVAVGGPRPGA